MVNPLSHQNSNKKNHFKDFQRFAKEERIKLTPQQLAVVAAILTNALDVQSILFDKDQTIQILLRGTLSPNNNLDSLLDEVRGLSIGDLFQIIEDSRTN